MFWAYSDLYSVFVAWFVCTTVLIGAIWFPKASKPGEKYQCFIVRGGITIIFTTFAYFGVLFLDTVIKEAAGIITPNNLNYHLGPMILLAIVAILILFASVFNAPTVRTLVSFGAVLGVYVYFFWFSDALLDNEMKPIYIPPLYILAAVAALEVAVLVVRAIRKPHVTTKPWRECWQEMLFTDEPLWDLSARFKRWISVKVWVVLWVLFSAEFILDFNGYSLLSWVPGAYIYWAGILIVAGLLLGIFIAYKKHRPANPFVPPGEEAPTLE
ncbi:MAG TPA: hypothetical protein VKK79_17850 [Candidatus Lokiarchaeia archaeon]|nr:hypothetical protein [Candidatus Lokiarchaeia archaeon]